MTRREVNAALLSAVALFAGSNSAWAQCPAGDSPSTATAVIGPHQKANWKTFCISRRLMRVVRIAGATWRRKQPENVRFGSGWD